MTGNEIDFLIALSFYQDERGTVQGVYYRDMMDDTGMSTQAFYDCKKALTQKGVITSKGVHRDYDITIVGNDFTAYTQEDYHAGEVKYIRMSAKLFQDINFKKLKPKQKLLVMDLYHIQNAGAPRNVQAYRIRRENFYAKYANSINADGTVCKGLLDITVRTLQKYLKMLQLYFYIGLKDGMYFFTLRKHFGKNAMNKKTENEVAMEHLLRVSCRRQRIKDIEQKEWRDTLYILLNHRKDIIHSSVNVSGLIREMIKILNVNIPNIRKWKRRLKASLFAKLLKEAIA